MESAEMRTNGKPTCACRFCDNA